jgi:hypothetical protein
MQQIDHVGGAAHGRRGRACRPALLRGSLRKGDACSASCACRPPTLAAGTIPVLGTAPTTNQPPPACLPTCLPACRPQDSDSDSDSSDSSDDEEGGAVAVNRDGTIASASREELKLAKQLAQSSRGSAGRWAQAQGGRGRRGPRAQGRAC